MRKKKAEQKAVRVYISSQISFIYVACTSSRRGLFLSLIWANFLQRRRFSKGSNPSFHRTKGTSIRTSRGSPNRSERSSRLHVRSTIHAPTSDPLQTPSVSPKRAKLTNVSHDEPVVRKVVPREMQSRKVGAGRVLETAEDL